MALEAVKFLWSKFLKSLVELESDLSGSITIFESVKSLVPIFNEIKKAMEEIDLLPEGDNYSELIIELYELNDAVAECRVFAQDCKELDKGLSRLNPFRFYFVKSMRSRLSTIKEKLSTIPPENYYNPVWNVGPMLPSEVVDAANEQSNLHMRALHQEISNPSENRGAEVSSSILGFDEHAKGIEDLLLEGTSTNVTAIGVVGVAGVGKTTLVQKVLERERVKENYSPILWIPFFSTKEGEQQYSRFFFETRIIDMGGKSADERIVGLDKLSERLDQLLSDKRYLIVLDDVCQKHINIEERLCSNLPKDRGGAVIITSRLKEVTRRLVEPKNLVLVKPLERDICWRIFKDTMDDKMFIYLYEDETRMEEITGNCHGLPSVAKALAEIMSELGKEKYAYEKIAEVKYNYERAKYHLV